MELVDIIEKIDRLKAELDGLRPLNPEQEARVQQKIRLEWNYHSNAIEGNTLTYGETRSLILFGLTAHGKPLKDHLDIQGHNEAVLLIEDIVKQHYPITEVFIRELHKVLLVEPYYVKAITPDGAPTRKLIQLGQYKTSPNNVETSTGEIFYFASPEETSAKMNDLMDWYNKAKEDKGLHPLIIAATFHYRFVRIHPFDDGNGRMARILMNLILLQYGFPPAIVKINDRAKYITALEEADEGQLDNFVKNIGEALIASLELYIKAARGESIEEEDDVDKELELVRRRLKIVNENINVEKSSEIILKSLQDTFTLFANKVKNDNSIAILFSGSNCSLDLRASDLMEDNKKQEIIRGFAENGKSLSGNLFFFSPRRFDIYLALLSFDWIGFKGSSKLPDFKYTISISFEDYKYTIKYKSEATEKELIKFYNQILTEEEQDQILREIKKQVLYFVKQQGNS